MVCGIVNKCPLHHHFLLVMVSSAGQKSHLHCCHLRSVVVSYVNQQKLPATQESFVLETLSVPWRRYVQDNVSNVVSLKLNIKTVHF